VATTEPALTPDVLTEEPTRQEVAARFHAVRDLTERLAEPLSAEDQAIQSMPDVSPTKWHRAHTTWFYETFLLTPYLTGYEVHHPAYGYLFNSYYEAVGPRHPRPQRGLLSRPGTAEIARYRAHVDRVMDNFVGQPWPARVWELVELGLHHEQQHQELILMDIKHVLSINPLAPAYLPLPLPEVGVSPPQTWADCRGGLLEIGHQGKGFAFDNECPRHTVYLQPFLLAGRPASCGDWLAFMDDGGYQRPELWLSDGWLAVQAAGWDAPLYWRRDGAEWQVYTLGGLRPVNEGEPVVHISYYEADAFARWSDARLPTEAEWEAAVATAAPASFPESADARLLDFAGLHPRPGGAFLGDVWEWTSSAYLPYPGFRPAPGAVGEYNGKFMVNQQVLRGGCCATPPGHLRPSYRNFFPPAARWPFSGCRLARDLERGLIHD
jgi:ergothioneine biosynthesis protein EgtB